LASDDFTTLNMISTAGSIVLGASTFVFFWNMYKTNKYAPMVNNDDPWGWGASLEWATSCPPPRHNFVEIPRIRSERPAFDLHHPEVAEMEEAARARAFDNAANGSKG
jgi:cytochrome c oxidase subunit 1